MAYSQLRIERDGGVLVCAFHNPPHGYMDRVTVEELDRFTAEAEQDGALRVIVFCGGLPGVFIRHYSVEELQALAERLRARGMVVDPDTPIPERQIDRVFNRLSAMSQVTIAAMNGTAMGGGFELALACDLRVGEDGEYRYGLPEVNLGILPGAGGTQRLARVVGPARAMEMILQGRTVSPAEAYRLGIVQELAPFGGAVERALRIARRIVGQPPRAVGHCKRLIRLATESPLADGLARERTLFLELLLSDTALARMRELNRGEREITT
jgi:enoyl-CoA hydratase/carnithine racemase